MDIGPEKTPRSRSGGVIWTNEAIIAALQAWAEKHGRPPTAKEWELSAPEHPANGTVLRRFGSWNLGMRAAGLTRRPAHHPPLGWTREQVIQAMFEFNYREGRQPRLRDWAGPSGEYPNWTVVVRVFGSWNAGVEEAGYKPGARHAYWTTDRVLFAIRHWHAKHGKPPVWRDWYRSEDGHPAMSSVKRLFGSWNAAIEAAGFEPNQRKPAPEEVAA